MLRVLYSFNQIAIGVFWFTGKIVAVFADLISSRYAGSVAYIVSRSSEHPSLLGNFKVARSFRVKS